MTIANRLSALLFTKAILVVGMLFLSFSIFSQEICDNGIDDDGDGYIDLLDAEDCSCGDFVIKSHIGDFEDYTCCPDNFTTFEGTGAYCLDDGWQINPSATTDYFNTCDYMGANLVPVPLPIPSGEGCIGMIGIFNSYFEIIGYCLPDRLIIGNTYTFGFYVGFGESQQYTSPLDIEVHLRGNDDCDNFPSTSTTCMSELPEWYDITIVDVLGDSSNTWKYAETTFVAVNQTSVVMVGIDCSNADQLQYHFMDSIFITGEFLEQSLSELDVDFSGDCESGVFLEVPGAPGATYQWYSDGIAIEDATENPYHIEPLVNGIYSVYIDYGDSCNISNEIEIEVDLEILVVDGTVSEIVCHDDNDAMIDIDPPSNNLPIDYMWSSGEDTEDLSDLSQGTYTITATDANGCLGTSTFVIDNPPEIITNLAITQPANGQPGASVLNVSGGVSGYTYQWSNGTTESSDSNLEPGLYSVTITDERGCESIVNFEIYQELLVLEIKTNEVCINACDGTISLDIMGGLPDYTILWDHGAQGENLDDLCAGEYYYTLQDSWGTSISDSVIIGEGSDILIEAEYDELVCIENNNTSITLIPEGGTAPYLYNWNNGDMSNVLTDIAAGTYTVTITDANDCIIINSYEIDLSSEITLEGIITDDDCSTDPLGAIDLIPIGGEGEFTYAWETGDIEEDLNMLFAGLYWVTVTDELGCTAAKFFIVDNPSDIVVESEIIHTDCENGNNGSINLTVEGGEAPYEYFWSSGQTEDQLSDLAPGSYTVTIVDNANCQQIEFYEIVGPNAINIDEVITQPSCANLDGGTIEVNVEGGEGNISLLWSNGMDGSILSDLAEGIYYLTVTDEAGCIDSVSYEIIEPSEIIVSGSTTQSSCGGGLDGSIELDFSGGTGTLSVLWNNGSEEDNLTGLSSGIYHVSISDENGCMVVDSFEVFEDAEINLDETIDHVSCFEAINGSIIIELSGGEEPYTTVWNTGSMESFISDLSSGQYSVTVTDANNCSRIQSFEVEQPPILELSGVETDALCFDANGSIELDVEGGTGNYVILWNTGESDLQIDAIADTDYSVTITDGNGCTLEQLFSVGQPEILNIDADITDPLCFGENGLIDLTISGGTPIYDILWNTGSVDNDLISQANTIYSVTITDLNGCEHSIDVSHGQPQAIDISVIDLNDPGVNNDDGSITIDISGGIEPYLILWNDSNNQDTELAEGLEAGTYEVVVTDNNGCIESIEITLAQAALALSFSEEQNVCFGECEGQISLDILGGLEPYSIVWSNGENGLIIQNLCDGIYSAIVTDESGNTIQTPDIEITSPPELQVSPSITAISCPGESDGQINVEPSGGIIPFDIAWNTGENTALIFDLSPGDYEVTITDANQCMVIQSYTINELFAPDFNVQVLAKECDELGYDVEIIGDFPNNYTFLLDGMPLELSQNNTISNLESGGYNLSYLWSPGCELELQEFQIEPDLEYEIQLTLDSIEAQFGETVQLGAELFSDMNLENYTLEWLVDNPFNCVHEDEHGQCDQIELVTNQGETISLLFTDEFGCETLLSIQLRVEANENVFIPNVFSPNDDGVNDHFEIFSNISDVNVQSLRIYDRWGNQVFEQLNVPIENLEPWDGAFLGSRAIEGVYVYALLIETPKGEVLNYIGDVSLVR
jgi:gliding motility-associated-like protein